MDDIIVYQLLKTKRRLTFDILYQREDTRYRGEDDGDYFTFRASNGYEVISRSRMDIQTERLWLLGASDDERSGSMVFSSDEKRDKAHENFVQALREWVAFIRTGGWGTRPTPELAIPVTPPEVGAEESQTVALGWVDLVARGEAAKEAILHSEGFATEADAAALLGLDADALRTKIADRSVFALPEPRTGAYRIPVWALHLDTIGLPTLRLHAIDPQIDPWEIHAFMSTPNGSLHGLRPFECLVDGEHLPLKLRALRDALVATMKLEGERPLVELVVRTLREEMKERQVPAPASEEAIEAS